MTNETPMPDMDDPRMPPRAVSVYGHDDAMDDFPVLKAFQQYIDAEQAKSRKRMTMLAIVFGVFTLAVIAVFVTLLIAASERNQKLNDRILEYVMKDRQTVAPAAAPVVVQSPAQQDNSALMAMTAQLEEMRKQLKETEERTQKAEKEAKDAAKKAIEDAAAALQPKPPSPEELEIQRLKSLLAKEREAAAAEKEKKRQEELEAYRRKHYPELYEPKQPAPKPPVQSQVTPRVKVAEPEPVEPIEDKESNDVDSPAEGSTLSMGQLDDILDLVSDSKEAKTPSKTKVQEEKPKVKVEPKAQEEKPKANSETKAKAEAKPYVRRSDVPLTIEGKDASWRIPD